MAFVPVLATILLAAAATARPYSPPPSKAMPSSCSEAASTLNLVDGAYDNHFYNDCHASSHVIVTSPRVGDDLDFIKPRLLVAWPAGNSGALALFEPTNGQAGTLTMKLEQSGTGGALRPVYETDAGATPRVGVSGTISFNDSATLAVPVLGSIRAIRSYVEGGSIDQAFQNNLGFGEYSDGSGSINRTWFDGLTTTTIKFTPLHGAQNVTVHVGAASTLLFGAGSYYFEASYNYPQLEQLSPQAVLTEAASDLIAQNPDLTTSLAFLSYTNKLLAGTWRFLTYFGRDSIISMLLMQSVLSDAAIEAVIGAVIERIDCQDGTVCHEEVIGDYASYVNRQAGLSSSSNPSCDYKMIDTDFMLPVAMQRYFVDTRSGQERKEAFFSQTASFLPANSGAAYAHLAQLTAEKIMQNAAPFAQSQVRANLIHLRDGQGVGEWRDSANGLGGGRTPYDVNTALVPAGLRAIAALSRAGFFSEHADWKDTADRYAQIWEDETLQFFQVTVSQSDARSRVQSYVANAGLSVPANANKITANVTFYGLAVDGTFNSGNVIPVMNTDDCFRHFFLNATNQTQLSAFLHQSATHILQPFPVGLSTRVGLVVANPAYTNDASYAAGFSQRDYHGTVVWSFQLAMMAAGLGRQLGRCSTDDVPDFCSDSQLYNKVVSAYSSLWDTIDANRAQLSSEVWSWSYNGGQYQAVSLGAITSTESNIRQLWSLTFLAVHRESFGA
ncbi:hypothetical protein ACEQ8H_008759 [Pleosporales sp. CAS-2024a]